MASKYEALIREIRERQTEKSEIAISPDNVGQVEAGLGTAEPMTARTDRLLFDYFNYLISELEKVVSLEVVAYPIAFYNAQVENLSAIRQKIIELAVAERAAIKARGANSTGQIGDYFWDNSEIEDLGEIKLLLDKLIGEAVNKFGVDPEEWHCKVNLER